MDQAHKDFFIKQKSIHSGHFDELVMEDSFCKVWVSRCETGSDGQPLVTIEHLIAGRWETTDTL